MSPEKEWIPFRLFIYSDSIITRLAKTGGPAVPRSLFCRIFLSNNSLAGNKWDFGQPNSGFYPLVKKNRFLLKMAIYSGFTMIYLFKIMVSRGYVSLPKGKWNWNQGPISDFPSEQLPDWKAVDTLGWWPILKNSLSQALTWVETETLWWSKSQSYEKFPRNLQDGHPSSRPRQNDWLWSTESFSIA